MASPHARGLPQLAFGAGSGFDNALNSPMTPQPQVAIWRRIAVTLLPPAEVSSAPAQSTQCWFVMQASMHVSKGQREQPAPRS